MIEDHQSRISECDKSMFLGQDNWRKCFRYSVNFESEYAESLAYPNFKLHCLMIDIEIVQVVDSVCPSPKNEFRLVNSIMHGFADQNSIALSEDFLTASSMNFLQ